MSHIPLSLPRRFVGDLLAAAAEVPLATARRQFDLAEVARARGLAEPRPSWCVVFTKAFGLLARRRPLLRRLFVPWPRPRLYEHPHSIATVSVERYVDGEPGVFFGHLCRPEERSLADLERDLSHYKLMALHEVSIYRRILRTSRLPWLLRRLMWGLPQWSGPMKARHFGTFGVSVVSGRGAVSTHLMTPITTALNYGVIGADGKVDVYLTFDQRVLAPLPATRALEELELVLHEDILPELRSTSR